MTDMNEYDPQSMIDSIEAENERLGRKTVERYEKVMKSDPYEVNKPSGGETWQTKATAKGAVPKYYSPTELLSMRIDRCESMIQDTMAAVVNLNERLSNISAEMLQPIDNDEIYERPKSK
tara:strand:- start:172 stop:531 length:360 start_codon:yes stop_codon:yes gene_type:complete